MNKPNSIKSMQLPPVSLQKYERYLPTAFDESLTILEKINKTIHAMYEYSKITSEMINKWNEVYEWVMEEGLNLAIVERLDEWVNDGTIEQIINEEIFGELNNNVDKVVTDLSSLKEDFILLQQETQEEFEKIDGAIEKIMQKAFYQEVKHSQHFDEISGSTYYLVNIPKYDYEGNLIKLKHHVSNKSNGELARNLSVEKNATMVMNASRFDDKSNRLVGLQMVDGEIINNIPYSYSYTLAFNDENKMKAFHPSISIHTIIEQGYTNALTGFHPIIENSSPVPNSVYESASNPTQKHPRQVIGQYPSGSIVIMTVDGRIGQEKGMTYDDLIRILTGLGVEFAYNLDGGGSTQTVVRGGLINNLSDEDSTKERPVFDFLYVEKEKNDLDKLKFYNEDIGYLSSKLSKVMGMVKNFTDLNMGYARLRGSSDYNYHGIEIWKGNERVSKLNIREDELELYNYTLNKTIFRVNSENGIITTAGKQATNLATVPKSENLNTLGDSRTVWCNAGQNVVGTPDNNVSWLIEHYYIDSQNKMQIATPYSNDTSITKKMRRTENGSFQSWRDI